MFAWLTENGRFLFWGVLAVLAGLLLVYLWRLERKLVHSQESRAASLRRASCAISIFGRRACRRTLAQPPRGSGIDGEHRPALALLYRGLLLAAGARSPGADQRFEHRGRLPRAGQPSLKDEERKACVSSLVRLWQRAVYGGGERADESVHALCGGLQARWIA